MTGKMVMGACGVAVVILGAASRSVRAARGKGTTGRFTAEEIARIPVQRLKEVVDPALLQRVPVSRIAGMSPEELACIMKVRRDYPLSVDFSPEQLASMSEEELARVVPRRYLDRYGLRLLAAMTPDELAHSIPTNIWLNLKPKRAAKVREKLILVTPEGNVYRDPTAYRSRVGATSVPWAIVLAPHPDDETYGIAGFTHHLYRSGWSVAQVLCTRGEASSYYRYGWSRGWWNSREEFGSYRVEEWYDATYRIAPVALRFCYDCGDQDLTVAEATGIVEYVNAYVGGASLVLATQGLPWEYHPDHQALADGLRQSSLADDLKRWYCVYSDRPLLPPHAVTYALTPQDRAAKNAALHEYKNGSEYHAIGYHSSPGVWAREYDDDCEYYTHLP